MTIRIDPQRAKNQLIGTYLGPGEGTWLHKVYVHVIIDGESVQRTVHIPKHDSLRTRPLIANTPVVCLETSNGFEIVAVQESSGHTTFGDDTQQTQDSEATYKNGRKRIYQKKAPSLLMQLKRMYKSNNQWYPPEIEIPEPKQYHPPDDFWPSRRNPYAE
jgi:hypothetical protein